jgi:hypothetical protein
MHTIEPFFNWRHLYTAEEDEKSPFFGVEANEFEFTQTIYNHYIHPQWNDFGSRTLYLKLLFVDYDVNFCIIELIGEWNDAIENDVAILKRSVIDKLIDNGITKFVLIGENVLNFHNSDNCYYEEWYEDVVEEGGWIVMIGLPEQSQQDFKKARINYFVELFDFEQWRTTLPNFLFVAVDNFMLKRLNKL